MSAKRKPAASTLPDDLLAAMLIALPTADFAPSAQRKAAIKKSLLMRIDQLAEPAAAKPALNDVLMVRAGEGRWINFAPNVDMKVLHDDGATRTWLARFGPGGRIPAHVQTGDEEAIIMEGWCYLDEARIDRGDYHLIRKGARHGNIHSPGGCLIFVRSHSLMRHASELTAAR